MDVCCIWSRGFLGRQSLWCRTQWNMDLDTWNNPTAAEEAPCYTLCSCKQLFEQLISKPGAAFKCLQVVLITCSNQRCRFSDQCWFPWTLSVFVSESNRYIKWAPFNWIQKSQQVLPIRVPQQKWKGQLAKQIQLVQLDYSTKMLCESCMR